MSKVFFSVVMSLDGFIAPDGMELEHAHDPAYKNWMQRWLALQQWTFQQKFFRENVLHMEGGDTGHDNDFMQKIFARTGVTILGRTMFDGGEMFWPEDAPFHTPVYVVTSRPREPWVRLGGTTFYFVTDGIESALQSALKAAGERDVRIGGGANAIVQYLNAGLIDEFTVSVSPVMLGAGVRLFDAVDADKVKFELVEAVNSPQVTHLSYRVLK